MLLLLAARFLVLPNIESRQGDIVSAVAQATGMDVSAKAIRGGWQGFLPYVELEEVVFREPADSRSATRAAGEEALRLPSMHASLYWWWLLVGQVRFGEVQLFGPELALTRAKDGLIYFAGRPLNSPKDTADDGRLTQMLLDQAGVSIHHAVLTWHDELAAARTLRFEDVGITIERRLNGHVVGFVATPPAALAKQLSVRGTLRLAKADGRWRVAGNLYADAVNANFGELRQHLNVSDQLQSGVGNVRAWVDLDNSQDGGIVRNITTDLHLINARAQLAADLNSLQFSRLAGRIEYKAEEGGFTVRSKALEFRTRDGLSLKPADFSVTLQHQADAAKATGEITANGIDLKVLTTLLEYFPIGRQVREFGARFQPRGELREFSLAWTGYLDKPATYRVKGRLADFGSSADDAQPGVSGFSGSVDGTEQGGVFTVASKNLEVDIPRMFRAPLKFATLDSAGKWKMTADTIEVDIATAKFANDELAGDLAGRYSRYRAGGAKAAEEKGPGTADFKGSFQRIQATAIANYLPNGAAKSREYIEWAVRDGEITSADFVLKGALYDFPFRGGAGGQFRIAAKVKDIDYRYLDAWPVINDANGEVVFENTSFSAKVESGKIFNAQLRNVAMAIDDFGNPQPTFTLQGGADARAEDVSRYLKESPLIDSIGGFTRFAALDGPGKLDLSLKIPMGANVDRARDPIRISGKYALNKGHAKLALGEKGVDVNALSGSIAFTETSLKSTGLAGIAYGNPLTATINGGGDAGVTIDFNARAEVQQVDDVLPFQLPQQVAGVTDFVGKVTTKAGLTEVVVDSNLVGVASTLPAPLTLRAEEARNLRVRFTNVGQPTERITISLAGSPGAGGAEGADTRISGRFQRRYDAKGVALGFFGGIVSVGDPVGDAALPEGLWFTGTLSRLDFDAWRNAFDNFYPPPPAGAKADAGKGDSVIAGFDFKLGGLLAYGRPFKAMSLKGRHSNEGWRMLVDSEEASGNFTWRPSAFQDMGLVRARLDHFVLVDEAPTAAPANAVVADAKDPDFPALDIIAEKFTFKGNQLGKLELRARPQGANWRIEKADITNGHAKLEMNGLWQRAGDPQYPDGKSRTTVNLKLDNSNLNALFEQFGYGAYLKGGKSKLEGVLSWPGHANQFSTSTLSGHFKVEANGGRFSKIEPGAGKLLGLLSLQAIPRRFTLDFRDIFSEGLAFDQIQGDVKLNNGIMLTENFRIKGPSAEIGMVGEVSLPAERQNLVLSVEPVIGEGMAIGIGVLMTPIAGVVGYGVSKVLEGALAYQLKVTGTWDTPQVEKVKGPSKAAAQPAPDVSNTAGEPARKSP